MDELSDLTANTTPSPTPVTSPSGTLPGVSIPPQKPQSPPPQPTQPSKANIWLSAILPIITLVIFLIVPSVVAITAINLNHNNVTINVAVPPVNLPQKPVTTPNSPPTVAPKTQTIVQIGSYRSIAEAKTAIKKLKINDALDISQLHIYKSTLPTGVWYRVAVPVTDVNVGNDMCKAYKALGNDCLVLTMNLNTGS